jgi:hypothetical protein
MPIDDLKHTSFFNVEKRWVFSIICWNAEIHEGMKPTNSFPRFNTMNALYHRTNCLYPEFCKRKNGEEEIIYDRPEEY